MGNLWEIWDVGNGIMSDFWPIRVLLVLIGVILQEIDACFCMLFS